jgi:hypothetical protein
MVFTRSQTVLFFLLFLSFLLIDLPVSIHQFVYTKWLIYSLIAIVGLIWLLKEKNYYLPKCSKPFWLTLFVVVFYKISQCILGNHFTITHTILDLLTSVILIIVGYNLFTKKVIKLDDIAFGIFGMTLVFLLITIWHVDLSPINFSRDKLAGNFGNINIAAEFMGLSLVFQISTLIRKQIDNRFRIFLYALSIGTSIFLYYASSRSVFLAVGTSICVLFFVNSISRINLIKFLGSLCVIAILLGTYGILQNGYLKLGNAQLIPDLEKNVSTYTRYQLLLATVDLIQHNPLGIGTGEFEFAIMPYVHKMMPEFNENVIPHAPHNEYLRLVVEQGIPFSIILFVLMGLLIYDNRMKFKKLFQKNPVIPAFLTFWLVQCVFQFPFSNAFSVLILASILSYIFHEFYNSKLDRINIRISYLSGIIFVSSVMMFSLTILTSEYFTLTETQSEEKSKLAYSLNSRNWYAGINFAKALINKKDLVKAREVLLYQLKNHSHHFVALRELAYVEWMDQRPKEACRLLKRYDAYFSNDSSYTAFRNSSCQSIGLDE